MNVRRICPFIEQNNLLEDGSLSAAVHQLLIVRQSMPRLLQYFSR